MRRYNIFSDTNELVIAQLGLDDIAVAKAETPKTLMTVVVAGLRGPGGPVMWVEGGGFPPQRT